MPNLLENPLDDLVGNIHQALTSWRKANTPESITKTIHNQLDKDTREIVLKIMGFDNRWGVWRLDHCNGRSGNSLAGDYLRDLQGDVIEKWLEQIELPELTADELNQIQSDIRSTYVRSLSDNLRIIVQRKASDDLDGIIESVTGTAMADKYNRLLKLLSSDTE